MGRFDEVGDVGCGGGALVASAWGGEEGGSSGVFLGCSMVYLRLFCGFLLFFVFFFCGVLWFLKDFLCCSMVFSFFLLQSRLVFQKQLVLEKT